MLRQAIVLVEDDPSILHDAYETLERAGYNVSPFTNADDALHDIFEQQGKISAVFSDLQVPGQIDGLMLAEIVGRHWPHVAVILTSGRVRPVRVLPDHTQFITKPCRLTQIVAALSARGL